MLYTGHGILWNWQQQSNPKAFAYCRKLFKIHLPNRKQENQFPLWVKTSKGQVFLNCFTENINFLTPENSKMAPKYPWNLSYELANKAATFFHWYCLTFIRWKIGKLWFFDPREFGMLLIITQSIFGFGWIKIRNCKVKLIHMAFFLCFDFFFLFLNFFKGFGCEWWRATGSCNIDWFHLI